MPDAHLGYGMPIGGVMAADDVVVPNAVGVDIGCGMCAVRTSLTSLDRDRLKTIMAAVRGLIPLGFKRHDRPRDESRMPALPEGFRLGELPVVSREYTNALTQLGTLGGGNHFIEIQRGNDGYIWIMVHSGSRNLGLKVAGHYNRLAADLNKRWKSEVNPKWQLAWLPCDSDEGRTYLAEMRFCVDFALANRTLMMEVIQDALVSTCAPVSFSSRINIAHNYAAAEHHFGREVIVHRKGATRARLGETGIIPGSQGAPSYIVRGLGNPESFCSCSHGAGRRMGRKEARRRLDLRRERQKLDRLGIIHSIRSRRDLDEAAGAYKDIGQVISSQEDLVEVVTTLNPLAVVKA